MPEKKTEDLAKSGYVIVSEKVHDAFLRHLEEGTGETACSKEINRQNSIKKELDLPVETAIMPIDSELTAMNIVLARKDHVVASRQLLKNYLHRAVFLGSNQERVEAIKKLKKIKKDSGIPLSVPIVPVSMVQ